MKSISMFLIATTVAATLMAGSDEDTQRLKASAEVISEIESAPDKGIPNDLFRKSTCVVVIPGMKKAGFIFSGKYGRGFASCRKTGGGWSAPAGMRIEGGGFGLQAGGSATDVIMLVMSKKGMEGLLASKFTLGGEASVAAGPVGRDATAQTDASMHADILSWSRSRGVFGGVSLQGGTLRPDEDANKSLYGEKVSSKDILTRTLNKPAPSDELAAKLQEYGGAEKAH